MKKRALSVLLAVTMLFSVLAFPVTAAESWEVSLLYSDLLLDVNLNQIAAVGHQLAGGYACSCFSLAYARTITDGWVHDFSEYNVYGADQYNVSASWSSGDYYRSEYPTKEEALIDLYGELQNRRPVLACVSGRGSTQHFVTVVGFENVTTLDELSEDNFLILDPIPSAAFEIENMGEVGYEIKYFSAGYGGNACYLLVRPLANVPEAELSESVLSDHRYISLCEDFPSSVILELTESFCPNTLPCDAETALLYDSVWGEQAEYPFFEGNTVEADRLYCNTEGEYWYRIALRDGTKGFLPAEVCGLSELILPRLEGGHFPDRITGATYLEGVIETNARIDSVQAMVFSGKTAGGKVVISSDVIPVDGKFYSLKYSMVDYTLPFQDLKKAGEGIYTLSYSVAHTNHYVNNGDLVTIRTDDMIGSHTFRFETAATAICTVSFAPNGGSCSVREKTAQKGSSVGELPTAERDGYTFVGWFTEKNGGEQFFSYTAVSSDLTVYAHWASETHRHSLKGDVTNPTCLNGGYTTYSCECGYSFRSDATDALGHKYSGGICVRCGESDPDSSESEAVVFHFGTVMGTPGSTVKIPLTVESSTAFNTMAVYKLTYNHELLEFVGFSDYGTMEEKAFMTNFDSHLEMLIIGLNTPQMLNEKVCDLVFRVKEDAAEGTFAVIDASSIVKLDSDMVSSSSEVGLAIVVRQIPGDIDGSGSVDIVDALSLFQHSLLPGFYPLDYVGNVDFQRDGTLDIHDVLYLFRHSMLPGMYPLT